MFLDCEKFGHWPIFVYDRPWWRLFRKRQWMQCIACGVNIPRSGHAPRYVVRYSIAGWVAWIVDTKTWKTMAFAFEMNEHGTADDSAEKEATAMCNYLNDIDGGR